MTDENDLIKAIEGKQSQYLLDQIRPLLMHQEQVILDKMKGEVRSGKATEVSLKVGMSMICGLEDLLETLNASIRRGEHYAAKARGE